MPVNTKVYNRYYPWVVVGLLWVVALLNYMDRQMLSTMKSAMMVDIEELQSATYFGYLMAVFPRAFCKGFHHSGGISVRAWAAV